MKEESEVESVLSNALSTQLDLDGIKCKQVIGKGVCSTVKLAWHESLHKHVAIKVVDRRSGSDYVVRFLPREVQILRSLSHQNIIAFFDVVEVHPFVCIVQEHADNGDLLQRIKRDGLIDEDESRFLFRQIIEALSYLESMRVVHRAVKCENVFLDSYDNVKLGDFGFSRYMHTNDLSRTFCGSRAYAAPEVLRSRPYNGFGVDVWSAGVVLYVMVTGLMLYDDRYPERMLDKQMHHRITFPSGRSLSEELKRLMFEMLHPKPSKRANYAQIIKSAWLINTPYRMRTEHRSSPPTSDFTSKSDKD